MKKKILKIAFIIVFSVFTMFGGVLWAGADLPVLNSRIILNAPPQDDPSIQGAVDPDNPTVPVTVDDGDANISIDVGTGSAGAQVSAMDILFLLAFLALLPTFLLMMTCFLRIIISLSFLRSAMGTMIPPNQVLIGIALFLTLFIMTPTIKEINDVAYKPYTEGTITGVAAIQEATGPLKKFMLKQTYDTDLRMFLTLSDEYELADETQFNSQEKLLDLSLFVIVPSFITSELKRGFMIGFLLYIPFLVIDIVVSSVLMSMGMVMLPPAMISLPFKLMLFVIVDGWGLLFESLIVSFH
ncbi:MAG: flagellar type III secretion system pore protein FliP [Oscillospiraceae bacterium]|jgi:flagellar biosynthetic protein FliP|nr:flagellar type III secretion system pore protein FliP [Oscillospiraceae bacterium]